MRKEVRRQGAGVVAGVVADTRGRALWPSLGRFYADFFDCIIIDGFL